MPSHSKPRVKLAAVSLALSVVSLMAYASIVTRASTTVFLISTGAALTAGIVSLVLGLIARKQMRQEGTGSKDRLLVPLSILVAIGYIVCLGIVAVNIVVYRAL